MKWTEQYLFFPNSFQRIISIIFLPLTLIYCIVTTLKRVSAKPKYYGIPVISIGNLLVGGTGKTPVTIALAKDKNYVGIVLRGSGRKSKGLYIISEKGKILENVNISGDEAMLLAISLPSATVIVSENKSEAILKAKELGCKLVFLDDGYSKHGVYKFDLLLRPKLEPTNIFCLPSGGYRDAKMMYAFADCVLKEDVHFRRKVCFKNMQEEVVELPSDILLLTAISKPYRLLDYLPLDIPFITYPDHYNFTQNDLDELERKYPNLAIVSTAKDMVKLKEISINNDIYLMDLEVIINDEILNKVDDYIKILS